MTFATFAFTSLVAMPFLMAQALPAGSGSEPQRSLILSLPPGGCSLMIHPDGSGVIHFGAAPQSVRVAEGSFDIQQVIGKVSPGLLPWSHRASLASEPARVTLPGGHHSWLSTDTRTIRSLLDQAWQVREAPDVLRLKHERWEQDWVKRACGFEQDE